jgi:hypothetical protein
MNAHLGDLARLGLVPAKCDVCRASGGRPLAPAKVRPGVMRRRRPATRERGDLNPDDAAQNELYLGAHAPRLGRTFERSI